MPASGYIFLAHHHPTKNSHLQPENLLVRRCRTVRGCGVRESSLLVGYRGFVFKPDGRPPTPLITKFPPYSSLFPFLFFAFSSPLFSQEFPFESERERATVFEGEEEEEEKTNQEVMTRKIIYGASLAAFVAGMSLRHFLRHFNLNQTHQLLTVGRGRVEIVPSILYKRTYPPPAQLPTLKRTTP